MNQVQWVIVNLPIGGLKKEFGYYGDGIESQEEFTRKHLVFLSISNKHR